MIMIVFTKSLKDIIISNCFKKVRNIKNIIKITKTIRIRRKKKKIRLKKKNKCLIAAEDSRLVPCLKQN
jgi:hypothetical protein